MVIFPIKWYYFQCKTIGGIILKNLVKGFLIFILLFSLAACGSESTSGSNEEKTNTKDEDKSSGKLLTKEEFEKMYTDPKKYKGSKVEFYAKVFVEPEKDDDGTYLQVYANNNGERNTIVGIGDPDLDVKIDDVILVKGTVEDVFEGENALGGTITAPAIKAESIEKSDYATAFAPALKTVDVNKEIDQHGYIVKLNKIEVAESETRLYVKITNNTDTNISFYSFNAKVVSGNQQFEIQDNYEAGYPEVQSDILPGVESEGIVVFPAIPDSGTVKVLFEGSSENYELEFKPFEFEVTY
ncbi:DUF4352 domain-containing protein [Cytobacillus oceanisediminis]|uniref:DUF4352 domain-containing protein n=1 Tax=Cytobacillus oceanisediminis TaxID=665099 RepID=A0A562JDE9_9BACI|nr:hypothetical protein IQ19_04401 [Cytobacillus oceanisediminis]